MPKHKKGMHFRQAPSTKAKKGQRGFKEDAYDFMNDLVQEAIGLREDLKAGAQENFAWVDKKVREWGHRTEPKAKRFWNDLQEKGDELFGAEPSEAKKLKRDFDQFLKDMTHNLSQLPQTIGKAARHLVENIKSLLNKIRSFFEDKLDLNPEEVSKKDDTSALDKRFYSRGKKKGW